MPVGVYIRNKNKSLPKKHQCQNCKKQFLDYASNHRKFCSKKCYGIWSSKNLIKENHNRWKGKKLTYSGFHKRVVRERGKPNICDTRKIKKSKRFEWANMNGKYYDPMDYKRLCTNCHRNYDAKRRRENVFI